MQSKILFLDIDGVLNVMRSGGFVPIERELVYRLNWIIEATDAKVVLSSMWRYLVHNGYMNAQGFTLLLRSHGFIGEVIDVTRPSQDIGEESEPRWKQIADWLKRPLIPVSRYAILDDDPDAFGGRPGVQPDGTIGLTYDDADRVIEILNGRPTSDR